LLDYLLHPLLHLHKILHFLKYYLENLLHHYHLLMMFLFLLPQKLHLHLLLQMLVVLVNLLDLLDFLVEDLLAEYFLFHPQFDHLLLKLHLLNLLVIHYH
jgi:hypothetical protein